MTTFKDIQPLLKQCRVQRVRRFTQSPYNLFEHSTVKMATTKDWSAEQYLKFNAERTRPSQDLLSQVSSTPNRIVDLGCGPGNSTAVLAARYPNAHITAIDSSPDMIKKAQFTVPHIKFAVEDLRTYRPSPDEPVDLFFSNAALHWLSSQERITVIKDLIETQPSGGVFAFQVPDNFDEPSHLAMRQTAEDGPWATTLSSLNPAREVFQSPHELYNQLKPLCSAVNVWHTSYYHVLDNHDDIVEWVKGTGLRPFIDPLSAEERDGFLKAYLERLKRAYPVLNDGKVILRYPRLFVVATKA
ncbi:hypothetical protein MAP00_003986 [Monascus purpureus]|nr:hypothetical protein MAP00_003986 [Monascus purpureus]